jgi:hypothetical protein
LYWQKKVIELFNVAFILKKYSQQVPRSSAKAASAAEVAALRKEEKYADLTAAYLFFPLAFQTMGPINSAGQDFISKLAHRISVSNPTEDPRKAIFLFQRISIALQHFNAVCFTCSFPSVMAVTRYFFNALL